VSLQPHRTLRLMSGMLAEVPIICPLSDFTFRTAAAVAASGKRSEHRCFGGGLLALCEVNWTITSVQIRLICHYVLL
jgi:hypothetical protein